mmetsp:Transcript_52525/g.125477  ORF Transcript_52525/g.125477 Transcript_52525/m.125477 type:complete len:210 (-) Transcript_52525:112-741(-)
MEADWQTSSTSYGVGYINAKQANRSLDQRVAGMTSFDCGYHSAANEFSRYERQMIRSLQDEAFSSGKRQPHPEMLRQFPNRERIAAVDSNFDRRPGSVQSRRSVHSRASGQSVRSKASHRSASASVAGSSIAGSVASSGPPPGFVRQVRHPVYSLATSTTNSLYGGGGHIGREPVPGRESWMLGRGGGQISSYDNCLVNKGAQVPGISA